MRNKMTFIRQAFVAIVTGSLVLLSIPGCGVVTAVADSKQQPPTNTYSSKKSPDLIFTAAMQAMGAFGKLTGADRTSGIVQGQKGNWTMSAGITGANGVSRVEVSARYVPSNRMDFYSREALTAEFVSLLEKNLGEKLSPISNPGTPLSGSQGAVTDNTAQQASKAIQPSTAPVELATDEKRKVHEMISLAEAQTRLTEIGYQPGPADGAMGKRTSYAISKFQREHGLRVTGRLNVETSEALRIAKVAN